MQLIVFTVLIITVTAFEEYDVPQGAKLIPVNEPFFIYGVAVYPSMNQGAANTLLIKPRHGERLGNDGSPVRQSPEMIGPPPGVDGQSPPPSEAPTSLAPASATEAPTPATEAPATEAPATEPAPAPAA